MPKPDELTESSINLNPAFDEGYGHAIVKILMPPRRWNPNLDMPTSGVQSTQIGLEAIHDETTMVSWATRLTDGQPLADVSVSLMPSQNATAVTDTHGVGAISKPDALDGSGYLLARNGRDLAFIPEDMWWWKDNSNWTRGQIRIE